MKTVTSAASSAGRPARRQPGLPCCPGALAPGPGRHRPRQRARAEAQARRQLRFEAWRRRRASGKRVREIAAELHMGPNTVRRFLRADAFPQRAVAAPRPSYHVRPIMS